MFFCIMNENFVNAKAAQKYINPPKHELRKISKSFFFAQCNIIKYCIYVYFRLVVHIKKQVKL